MPLYTFRRVHPSFDTMVIEKAQRPYFTINQYLEIGETPDLSPEEFAEKICERLEIGEGVQAYANEL